MSCRRDMSATCPRHVQLRCIVSLPKVARSAETLVDIVVLKSLKFNTQGYHMINGGAIGHFTHFTPQWSLRVCRATVIQHP
eukprot:scaffold17125_cov79-Cyclotella_meneghiniana.AAC.1